MVITQFPWQVRELGEHDAGVEIEEGNLIDMFRRVYEGAVADGDVTPREQMVMNHLLAKIEERHATSLRLTRRINAEINAAALGLDPDSETARRRLVALREPREDLVA